MIVSSETLLHKSYLTVMMSSAHVVETSVTVTNNSALQGYTHLKYHLDYL